MTLIRDLIDLPDQVRRGDFVLKLAEGLTKPKETVENYVVTPQLAKCFDEALGFIRSAVESRTSKATYLHGSFGSGKSHFMAILHLLLQGNREARSIPELADIIVKHNQWTTGRRFLLVPLHLINSESMESAILGGYAGYVRHEHPDAPTPGVYLADQILKDASNLRQAMGDAVFFDKLNESCTATAGEWGMLETQWNAESFDRALAAPPTDQERSTLVGVLVDQFFQAVRHASTFIDLDQGLSIISQHAKSLGYDALIFFLDELILWLATRAADVAFVNREGQKLAKLVEAQSANRPVPIISFVARQRDLKKLVADQVTGAEWVSFADVLNYWEARFHKITLEDRNLPVIAEKRLLKPKSEAARVLMDEEFRKTASIREEVMSVLLTSDANREVFRRVYPFSPALVDTLVEVSFLLQRERTALKVMLQLLVEQRDRLKLGDIVPVGDLFDAISEGDEAFVEKMRVDFENARKLYEQKFRQLLEEDAKIQFSEIATLPVDDPRVTALRTDDRLVKTLLLAALAPNVESLRGMTAARLAALNHGTIKSPIPGREAQTVITKCRKWAAEIGQLKIGDGPNPTISIQLTGIDTDSIIEQARTEDNRSNRIRKIKELLFKETGIQDTDQLYLHFDFTWRATRRTCEVLLANVRELPDESLRSQGDEWKVIFDYPFDEEGHTPQEDLERLARFRAHHPQGSRTLVWLPSFLSRQSQKDLGLLVILDYILMGDRLSSYVAHLSPADRSTARTILENQRSQLKQRLITILEGIYGIGRAVTGSVDMFSDFGLADHFQSLDPGLMLQPPVSARFQDIPSLTMTPN